jgi:hypothetical protein
MQCGAVQCRWRGQLGTARQEGCWMQSTRDKAHSVVGNTVKKRKRELSSAETRAARAEMAKCPHESESRGREGGAALWRVCIP